MTLLRILTLIAWSGLALYMVQGAWSALFGRVQRRGDPMRLGTLTVALLMIGFNLRWLVARENEDLTQALLVLSIGTAAGIAWLARTYGRGPYV